MKCLGSVSRLEAETLAHGLAYEHGKRILALRALRRGDHRSSGSAQIRDLSKSILSPAPTALTSAATTSGVGFDREAGTGVGPSLLDLVKLWERVRAPRSAISKNQTRLCVRRFVERFGDIRSEDVTREHAIAYRDALVSRLKPENVAGHLTRMHVLFSVAMGEGLIPTNPFHNVRVQKRSGSVSRRREGFTSDHVKAIFAALERRARTSPGWCGCSPFMGCGAERRVSFAVMT